MRSVSALRSTCSAVEVLLAEIDREELPERGEQAVEVPVLDEVARRVLVDRALDHLRHLAGAPPRRCSCLRAPRRGRRRSRGAARSSRRRTRARVCGSGSSAPRPSSGLSRSVWRASPPRSVPRCPPRRRRRVCRGSGRCDRPRTGARGRPRRRGRSAISPGSPWRPAAPAQLVVDAPRLVALGAADEQAAGRHHVLAALLDLAFDLRQHAPACAARSPRRRARRPRARAAGGRGARRCRRA